MTLIQAILLGGCYWAWVNEIGSSVNHAIFGLPATACLWYGLILGDVPTALYCGATIMPLYLGYVAAGGIVPTDRTAAGLIPTAAVICYGMDINVALALAIPVGILFSQLHTLRRIIGSWYIRRAEKIIQKDCDGKKLYLNGILLPSLVKIVICWLPMTLICYFALQSVSELMDQIPEWLNGGLSAVGCVLPSLGMGLLLNSMGDKKFLPFFFTGFFLVQYMAIDNIALLLIALFLAWFYMTVTKGRQNVSAAKEETEDVSPTTEKITPILTKRDIIGAYWRWMAFNEVPSSYERHMGYGILMSFYPCLKKLYKGRPEELKEACMRHLSYFNTEQFWGAGVPGIALALEEQKALGAPITGEMIESVKAGLMGPFAGLGDSINWVTLRPMWLMFFLPYIAEGHVWAAVAPMVIEIAVTNIEGLTLFPMGYRLGIDAANKLLSSGLFNTFFKFVGVLGMFMVGGLSAGLVKVSIPISYVAQGGEQTVQTLLDSIIPGLPALAVIMFVYIFLEKKGKKRVNLCTLWLVLGALELGCLGIIA